MYRRRLAGRTCGNSGPISHVQANGLYTIIHVVQQKVVAKARADNELIPCFLTPSEIAEIINVDVKDFTFAFTLWDNKPTCHCSSFEVNHKESSIICSTGQLQSAVFHKKPQDQSKRCNSRHNLMLWELHKLVCSRLKCWWGPDSPNILKLHQTAP